ncbi:hypothetical protein, partial [Streptomyces californicus]|uniref:hypothetical protein n=1 Tax=Streptomyces californicus TaxID=67351 RepID=UPI00200F171C
MRAALRDGVRRVRVGVQPGCVGGQRDEAGAAPTRAALAIDNARRFEREHVIASTVQRRLLPQAA